MGDGGAMAVGLSELLQPSLASVVALIVRCRLIRACFNPNRANGPCMDLGM